MGEKTERSTGQRELKARAMLAVTTLPFATMVVLVLALLAYLLDLWGGDIVRIDITVPAGLLFLILVSAIIGTVLQHSRTVERKNARLEQELSASASRPPGDYNLHIVGGKVFRGKQELYLTPGEFRLLESLVTRDRKICGYEYIFEQVWPDESQSAVPPSRDNLAALVLRLRNKINVRHDYIKNHPSRGYEFVQWER